MGSPLPPQIKPKTLDEILAELRARRDSGEPPFIRPYREPSALPQPPTEEDETLLGRALSGLGTAHRALSWPTRQLAREVYKLEFPGVPEERIPELETMAAQTVVPETGQPFTSNEVFGRRVAENVANVATDPITGALVAGAASGAPLLSLALLGGMGYAAAKNAWSFQKEFRDNGWSPKAAEHAADLAVDAGLIAGPLAWRKLFGRDLSVREEAPPTVPGEGPVPPRAEPPVPPSAGPTPPGAPVEPFGPQPLGAPPPYGPRMPYVHPAAPRNPLHEWTSGQLEHLVSILSRDLEAPSVPDRVRRDLIATINRLKAALETKRRLDVDAAAGESSANVPPPSTSLGRSTEPFVTGTIEGITTALENARKTNAPQQQIEALERARQQLIDEQTRAAQAPKRPEPPPPGTPTGPLGPPPGPMPPPGQAPGPGPAPGSAPPPPGPRTTTVIEGRAPAPGEPPTGPLGPPPGETPIEAAGRRAEETRGRTAELGKRAEDIVGGTPGPGGELPPPTATGRIRDLASRAAEGAPGVPLPPTVPGAPPSSVPGLPVPGAPTIPPGPPAPPPPPAAPPPVTEAPTETPVAPGGPPEPKPQRTLRIGRGAHGQVSVEFPDRAHADLFSSLGRLRRARGERPPRPGETPRVISEGRQLAKRFGIHPDRIYGEADRYRDRVMRGISLLPEGAEYKAPRFDEPEEPRPEPKRAEAPPNAVRGDIGRAPAGVGWVVRTYDKDGNVVSESDPIQLKDAAKLQLRELQPTLRANREGPPPPAQTKPEEPAPEQGVLLPPSQEMAGEPELQVEPAKPGSFQELANAQRDAPEAAMVRAQRALGGGVMSHAIEHSGDLIHRMTNQGPTWGYGYEWVSEKVKALLGSLDRGPGFGDPSRRDWLTFMQEHAQNLASNADYGKQDREAYRRNAEAALAQYIDEHLKLPVYNQAQAVARMIPVEIASGNIKNAIARLRTLESHLGSREDWVAYAGQNDVGAEAEPEPETVPIDEELEKDLGTGDSPQSPDEIPEEPDHIASLPQMFREAIERALGRIPADPPQLRLDARSETNRQISQLKIIGYNQDEYGYVKLTKTLKGRARKLKLTRERLNSAKTLYEAGWDSMRAGLSGVPDAAKIVARVRQLVEHKGIRTSSAKAEREASVVLPRISSAIHGFLDATGSPITQEEAEATVAGWAKEYDIPAVEAISSLERLAGQIDRLGETALSRWVDIPGIGRKTIKEILSAGQAHPKWGVLVEHLRQSQAEDAAFWELVGEHQEPAPQPRLVEIADALQEDLLGLETNPDPEAPDPISVTFMAGIVDPSTGEPVTTANAIAAIRAGRGRLHARILWEYEAAKAAAADDIPFDVPEDGIDDSGIVESSAKRLTQDLIPGFLDAVVNTPGRAPVQRPDKPAVNFADSELFRQDEAKAERKAAEEFLSRQKTLEEGDLPPTKSPRRVLMMVRSSDPFRGRYGPPPRRMTQDAQKARERWAKILGGRSGIPTQGRPTAAPTGGEATGQAERPVGRGVPGAEPAGEAGGVVGRGRRRGGVAPGAPTAGGEPKARGIFSIIDPREEFTWQQEPKFELIPERLRGLDEAGRPLLTDDQKIGVAKAIEATEAGSGFLFEDGTGVGKTREILAVAEHWRTRDLSAQDGRKHKVLIVSKASAIEPTKVGEEWMPSGSYSDDSAALGVPITFLKKRIEMKHGTVYLGTYHDLRHYMVDKDTVLIFDEAHALKNAGSSEVAAAGHDLIRKAKVSVFATATPGDKPYHMMYLASIGIFEGQPPEEAIRKLGATTAPKKKFSKALYKRLVKEGMDPGQAKEKAVETFNVWQVTSPTKMKREVEKLFERLTARGTVVKREVDLSALDVRTVVVPMPEEARQAMAVIEQGKFDRKGMLMHMRRQQEPFKIPKVQELVRTELSEGRQVVVFAQRVNRSDVKERIKLSDGDWVERILMSSEGTLKQLAEWLRAEGIPFAEIHGSAGESSKVAQQRFQSGEAKVVIATYEKGGTGINLDDRTGAAPRTMIMMTAPFGATDVVQALGRIHRLTTRSSGRVHMLFTDHQVDKWNGAILATKISMLHAMVSGDIALLDPSVLGGGEDALQVGQVHYREAMRRLLGFASGAGGGAASLYSAKQWGLLVRILKSMGAQINLRGGDFEIPTHEGFTITGSLEKVRGERRYGTFRWEHDPEATEFIQAVRLEERANPKLSALGSPEIHNKLAILQWIASGQARSHDKPIVSARQYNFVLKTLNDLGAIWGGDEDGVGGWTITASDGVVFLGELRAPVIAEGQDRAEPENRGLFYWMRPAAGGTTEVRAPRRTLTDSLIERIERGASFRDLYTRHQPALRALFGNDFDLFTRMLAITFQAADTKTSFGLALKAYKQFRLGLPFTGYMKPVRRALEKLANGEPDYIRGPKMAPFLLASTNEDIDAIAVDRHVGRFLFGDAWTASEKQIAQAKETLLAAARLLGWSGREVQAAAWAASQIESGLDPEEIQTYDEVLRQRATEIRQFRDYFGDAAGPRGWNAPALRALEDSQKSSPSSDPDSESPSLVRNSSSWGHLITYHESPNLKWFSPARVGLGVDPEAAIPQIVTSVTPSAGVSFPGATKSLIQEGFERLHGIVWPTQNITINGPEDAAALFQVARNPSLEHGQIFITDTNGRIVWQEQATSNSPDFVKYPGVILSIRRALFGLASQGVQVGKIYSLHNHPSGNPTPSRTDVIHAIKLYDEFGATFGGMIVSNHERAVIVQPEGLRVNMWGVVRSAQGFIDPDPFLSPLHHDPNSILQIQTADELRAFVAGMLESGFFQMDGSAVSLVWLDSRLLLRGISTIPRELFENPFLLRLFVARAGRIMGATTSFGVANSWTPNLRFVVPAYMDQGLISDFAIVGHPTTALENRLAGGIPPLKSGLDWIDLLDTVYASGPVNGILYTKESPSKRYGPGKAWNPNNIIGAGGAGLPPPPPGALPFADPDDPDWWERRVRFARARVNERMTEASSFVDPRAFWDAFVLGVDALMRGFKTFFRWLGELARDIPNISSWGRSLWNYLKSIFGGVIVERPGRPRPLEEAVGEAARAAGRGPIRPVPQGSTRDMLRYLESLLRGEPIDPGTGRPIGVRRPGDLPINIHTIRDEAGVVEAITRMARILEDRFAVARRPTTQAEIRRLALELGYTEGEYLRMVREKGALTAPEIIAGRVLRQEAGIDFTQKYGAWRDAVRRAEELAPDAAEPERAALSAAQLEAEREMRAAMQKFIGISYGTAAAGSEAGRALHAHRMMVQSLTPEERWLQRLFRGQRPDEALLARIVEALRRGDMAEVGRVTRQLHKPGIVRTLSEYFINSLISAPSTPAANVLGNLTHEVALRTPERALAARLEQLGVRQWLERILTGESKPTERTVGEATAAIREHIKWRFGLPQALKLSWTALGREDVRFMTGIKGEYYPPAIPGVLGKIVRTPGRVMEALDLGARHAAMSAERAAQVWRKTVFEAAERGGYDRARFNERFDEINRTLERWILLEDNRRMNPREFLSVHGQEGYNFLVRHREMSKIYDAMKRAGDESTFRDETTKFTNYIKAMRGTYPWLTFLVPFVNTPERILVQALRRTPVGLAKTVYNVYTGRLSGGTASDRIAQGVLGSMVTGAIYMMAKDGFITGGGPADPDTRRNWLKTGKKPYAIKVGNEWVSLARIEPLATTMGFASDLAEAQDEKIAGDLFDKLHYSVINNIANKTYLQGLVSAAEAFGDPDRYGARLWKQMVGAAVPNIFAAAARAIDPTIRQTDSLEDTLLSRIPVLSMGVPAKLSGTGESILREETALSRFISPFRYSEEAGPEANLERLFLETGYNPSAPPKTMSVPGGLGRRVELTRAEREIYSAYTKRLTSFARELAKNTDFGNLDVYAKTEVLKRLYRFAHDAARRDVQASVIRRLQAGAAEIT